MQEPTLVIMAAGVGSRFGGLKQMKSVDNAGHAITGYNTQSILVAPIRSREDNQIGVIQLINAMDRSGHVCEFHEELALIIENAASQSAVTIQNVRYLDEIKELFRFFVRVMSSAVEERTPYNSSHTKTWWPVEPVFWIT